MLHDFSIVEATALYTEGCNVKTFNCRGREKVCQLIQYIVDWDALEIEIVGIVNDGEDAYREILDKRPDI